MVSVDPRTGSDNDTRALSHLNVRVLSVEGGQLLLGVQHKQLLCIVAVRGHIVRVKLVLQKQQSV